MPLNLQGANINNVNAIYSASGKWRIDDSGLLVVEEVRAKRGTFEEGVTVFDKITGQPKCVIVANDIVKAEQGKCGIPATLPTGDSQETATTTP